MSFHSTSHVPHHSGQDLLFEQRLPTLLRLCFVNIIKQVLAGKDGDARLGSYLPPCFERLRQLSLADSE